MLTMVLEELALGGLPFGHGYIFFGIYKSQ
jgi:hypothetical protein